MDRLTRIAARAAVATAALVSSLGCGHSAPPAVTSAATTVASPPHGAFADVHGLSMYYEVHGDGPPLVLLHGGLATIESSFADVMPVLSRTRTVIAVEQQGHGHTPDVDRPLSYEQMAEDTVTLLAQLGVGKADFFGWSDGGVVALRIAMRHPERVHRLVLLSSAYDDTGEDPSAGSIEDLTPDMIPPVFREAYVRVAPDPGHFPALVEKIRGLALHFHGWSQDEVRAVQAPTLVMLGDRDIITVDYAARMARLLPHAELAVLPGCDHFAIRARPSWVLALSTGFLDAQPAP